MAIAKVTITFEASSGLPKDRFVNQLVVNTGAESIFAEPTTNAIAARLINLYSNINTPGTAALLSYFGRQVSRSIAPTIRIYDITAHLDGSPHGSPVRTLAYGGGMGALPATSLPSEVALCVTLRGDDWATTPVETADGPDAGIALDRPRQRKTGRVYFGPFTTSASATATGSGEAIPDGNMRNAALYGLRAFHTGLVADGQAGLVVWSRVDADWSPVTHLQVDNAWDTQRRRGFAPTERDTVSV